MELADEVPDPGPGQAASPRVSGWNVHSLRRPRPGPTRTPWGSEDAYSQTFVFIREIRGSRNKQSFLLTTNGTSFHEW